jgi:capsular polysaccharide export protein
MTEPGGFEHAGVVRVLGFSLRKRRLLRGFLPGVRLQPIAEARDASPGDTVVVWASSPQEQAAAQRDDLAVWRVEDGFLRSVGLGAGLARPLSWVVDRRGIHYDPTRPSDLEAMLQAGGFDAALIERAQLLRARIVAAAISKYNVGNRQWPGLSTAARGRPVVLVVGQVEADAAVRRGTVGIATNVALLQAARARHPDAWLVYKPHPDVVAGLRAAGRGEQDAGTLCDEVAVDAPITDLLEVVDDVHVMTSLAGFEALLRGKRVHCHGQPFYAGWGLTTDSHPVPRRTRRVSLDELVAAALIRYPRYVTRDGGRPCEAERTLQDLMDWRRSDSGKARWWQRALTPVLRHE